MNIQQIRNDTPACKDKLFLNSAGASLMPSVVTQKIYSYLKEEECFGGYKAAEKYKNEIQDFYNASAQLLNSHSRNISFAFNATDAYARVLSSIPFEKNQIIITTDDDYVSNYLNFLALKEKYGILIHRIRTMDSGELDMNHFRELATKPGVALVAVTHVPTNSGLIQDVYSIGKICLKHDLLYLVDACQSVGQLPIDVQELHCDFLSVTGRKFLRGPRGTGLLYVSDRVLNMGLAPLFLDLKGADWISEDKFSIIDSAQRYELWELPYALLLGLKESILYALDLNLESIRDTNKQLIQRLNHNLTQIKDIHQHDRGIHKSNILTFHKEGKGLEETTRFLDKNKVYYSVAHRSNALIDLKKKNREWVIRFSPHYFNTLKEMDQVSELLEAL